MQAHRPIPKKLQWYLPTINGDIRLTREAPKQTILHAYELTPSETQAMAGLREKALSTKWGKQPWCDPAAFLPIDHATYRTGEGIVLHLAAAIEDVQATLATALKPRRSLITAVRFSNGNIEEAVASRSEDGGHRLSMPSIPGDRPSGDYPIEEAWSDVHPGVIAEQRAAAERAATVATPTVGCPMPEFEAAEVRASFVLEQFLTPDQIEDYRRYGTFVSVGHDTGRRYMVIHRERPDVLKKYAGRQLFDLEAGHALCVHDWEVPPAEEMLALHLCLHLPGRERYIRSLPETWHG